MCTNGNATCCKFQADEKKTSSVVADARFKKSKKSFAISSIKFQIIFTNNVACTRGGRNLMWKRERAEFPCATVRGNLLVRYSLSYDPFTLILNPQCKPHRK